MDDKSRFDTFQAFPFQDFDRNCRKVERIRDIFLRTPTDPMEQVLLYELAGGIHDDVEYGHILEIGTDYGSSTAVMALGARDNGKELPVFTLDLFRHYTPDKHEADRLNDRLRNVRRSFHELDLIDQVCQIICNDKTYLPFWDLPIRLAFVDASHSYSAVTREIHMIRNYLVSGGWVVFHDYVHRLEYGVTPAVNQFIDSQPLYSIRVFRCESMVAIQRISDDTKRF